MKFPSNKSCPEKRDFRDRHTDRYELLGPPQTFIRDLVALGCSPAWPPSFRYTVSSLYLTIFKIEGIDAGEFGILRLQPRSHDSLRSQGKQSGKRQVKLDQQCQAWAASSCTVFGNIP